MSGDPSGVVAVDKPGGMTSHDVVARARRMLGTRRIGHAGTLDPMATGVLVLLVGEATKLGPYLTAHRKSYVARVALGVATDTLDREGAVTATADVPPWLRDELGAARARPRLGEALAAEAGRTQQVPPAFSAIHVDGRRSYDRARAGEAVELAARPVEVLALRIVGAGAEDGGAGLPFVDVELEVSKGYYVRSLARDLGERIGVPAHLSALRRTASGPFAIAGAVALAPEALRAGLVPLAEAARAALPIGRLTDAGALRARRGQSLAPADFAELSPPDEAAAWLDPRGRLVAIGTRGAAGSAGEPQLVSHRGFVAGGVE